MIPKQIFTVWFSETGMPELIQKCIQSQKLEGYQHRVISLDNYPLIHPYVNDAIKAKKWVKAVDYLRMVYLYQYGGIFLDADVEILAGKDFNLLLSEQMFVGMESNRNGLVVLGTAVIGAEAGHPLIKEWIDEVNANFKGDDDKNYESSMHILNIIGVKYQDRMMLLQPDVFYPYDHFTGAKNITDNTIAIHHFLKSWIPKPEFNNYRRSWKSDEMLAEDHTLIETLTKRITTGENFTFVKRGDGEVACMNGEIGGNCDGHPYSKELGDGLKSAYEYLGKNGATIVDFEDQNIYNSLLHRTDNNMELVSNFYKEIAASPRKKIFIAPAKLSQMSSILRASNHIVVPAVNAFNWYQSGIEFPIEENAIYLFCAGMPAKIMIADLARKNPNATYIDCGSAFDPIAHVSRTYQISTEEFKKLYEPDVTSHIGLDNFKIPQETHPERLFAIANIRGAKVVYDLGCGTHKTVDYAVGVDVRPVTDIKASIDDLPMVKSDSVDAIISRHSLEHVLDPVKAIKEWIRILKPTGKIVVVLPDHSRINTIDPIYSNGEHLHAFTPQSFANLIALFPELKLYGYTVVLKDWSFGAVIGCNKSVHVPSYDESTLPTVDFIIPQLGREEGLKKCTDSIHALNYPQHLINIEIIEGDQTVPKKMKWGVDNTKGELIVYAANDTVFHPDSLLHAVAASEHHALVAFNTGDVLPDEGNICEHFLVKRSFVEKLGGEVFDTDFHHTGCDNLLWYKASKLGQAYRCEEAVVEHNHFSRGGQLDPVYLKGWSYVEEDRTLLEKKKEEVNNQLNNVATVTEQ